MSGVYLTVWDNKKKDNSLLLKTTRGGYPHITLAYVGNLSDKKATDALFEEACKYCKPWIMTEIHVNDAHINSFIKDGKKRYDVVLTFEESAKFKQLREKHYSHLEGTWDAYSILPHITRNICWNEEEAFEKLDECLNIIRWNNESYPCVITGVTVD